MEQNQKNMDCYFFYYSKCSKGDSCAFRHEPSALGCETVCSYWQQGNCLNEHCNFRHMELKKNRKSIACYWETQPSGCMKPHCPFLHRNERPVIESTPINQVKTPETISPKPTNQEWSNRQEESKFDGSSTESDQGRGSSEASSFIGSPVVDPLIVNFEEESDSEDAASPVKRSHRISFSPEEQEKLNAIQSEVADYYKYSTTSTTNQTFAWKYLGGGKITRVSTYRENRIHRSKYQWKNSTSADTDFKILSLEEIRKRKQARVQGLGLSIKMRAQNSLKNTLTQLKDLKKKNELKKLNELKKSNTKICVIDLVDDDDVVEKQKPKILKIERVQIPPIKLQRLFKLGEISKGKRTTPKDCDTFSLDENEILSDIDALLNN